MVNFWIFKFKQYDKLLLNLVVWTILYGTFVLQLNLHIDQMIDWKGLVYLKPSHNFKTHI